MFRKRRRSRLLVSDSSDEDTQSRKVAHNRPRYAANRSQQRRNEISGEADISSESDFTHSPRKKCKRLRLYSSEETDSTDDKEIVCPIRQGSVRALSDYESGTSSDHSSSATGDNTRAVINGAESLEMGNSLQDTHSYRDVITKNSGMFVVTMERNGNVSESSSTSSVILPSKNKSSRRSTNVFYSSDSSESERPIIMRKHRKRDRLPSTDDESGSNNSIPGSGGNDTENNSFNTSGHRNSIQYRVRVQPSRRCVNTERNRFRMRNADNDSSSSNDSNSDSDIPISNNSFRNSVRITTDSSSSDTEDVVPTITRLRRGAVIPLNESDGDDAVTSGNRIENNAASQRQQTCQINSSDSDSESEKCTICLGNFKGKEIGVPANCEHHFCLGCIQEWARNNNTCPVDRKQFNELIVYDKEEGNVIRRIPVEITPTDDFFEVVSVLQYVDADDVTFTIQQRFTNNLENENTVVEDNWRAIFGLDTAEDDEDGDGPEEICRICFQDDDNNSGMIVCDECYRVFHLSCVNLSYIPVENWYCHSCASVN